MYVFIFIIALLYNEINQAQNDFFAHSFGFEYNSYHTASSIGILYSPRVNFISIPKNSYLSFGTHISGGLAWHSFISGNTYYFQSPLVIEFHYGKGSIPNVRKILGGFVGAGYGFHLIGSEKAWRVKEYEAHGIVLTTGLRHVFKEINLPFCLRIQYLFNLKNSLYGVWSVGISYFFKELK